MYSLRKQRGTAAVEFALIVPLLLLLIAGLIDFGHLFWHRHVLTNAAREGARAAVKREDAGPAVTNYINNAGLDISLKVDVLCDNNPCDTNPPVLGTEITVTVTELSYQFPILPLEGMFPDITQLVAVAIMRHQG